jgi:hypothetical protein
MITWNTSQFITHPLRILLGGASALSLLLQFALVVLQRQEISWRGQRLYGMSYLGFRNGLGSHIDASGYSEVHFTS